MGLNLDYSKQSFESLVAQMDTPIKVQFVVWLDERLAEYKVQGFMNFNTQLPVPRWLKTYNKYANKSNLSGNRNRQSLASNHGSIHTNRTPVSTTPNRVSTITNRTPKVNRLVAQTEYLHELASDQTVESRVPVPHVSATHETFQTDDVTDSVVSNIPSSQDSSDLNGSQVLDQSGGTKEELEEEETLSTSKAIVKTEPSEGGSDDVVMVLPDDVMQSDQSFQPPERIYKQNYTISQSRPIKSSRPAHRFTPKNSYAAAVARKRKLSRPQQRPSETIVHPSQQQTSVLLHSQNDTSESIYAAGNYDDGSGFVETDPSVLASQGVYATEDEYIQFPVGSDPVGQGQQTTVKTEYYDAEGGGASTSFNEQSLSDAQMLGMDEAGLDSSYDSSFNEGGEPGTGSLQESWMVSLGQFLKKIQTPFLFGNDNNITRISDLSDSDIKTSIKSEEMEQNALPNLSLDDDDDRDLINTPTHSKVTPKKEATSKRAQLMREKRAILKSDPEAWATFKKKEADRSRARRQMRSAEEIQRDKEAASERSKKYYQNQMKEGKLPKKQKPKVLTGVEKIIAREQDKIYKRQWRKNQTPEQAAWYRKVNRDRKRFIKVLGHCDNEGGVVEAISGSEEYCISINEDIKDTTESQ